MNKDTDIVFVRDEDAPLLSPPLMEQGYALAGLIRIFLARINDLAVSPGAAYSFGNHGGRRH
jgi:hypothetical protein